MVDAIFLDGVIAIRGVGKYRLRPEFAEFYRNPTKWNQMSIESQDVIIDKFDKYTPDQIVYQKPGSSGLKSSSGKNKKRVNLPETEVFVNRLALPASPKHLKIDHYQNSGQDDGLQDESIRICCLILIEMTHHNVNKMF